MSSVSSSWPEATPDREYKRVTEEIGACFFIAGSSRSSTNPRWFRINAENKTKCLTCIRSQAAGKSQGTCWHLANEPRCKRCINGGRCDQPSQLLIHMVAHTENQVNLFGGTHIVERWQQVAAQARHEEKCLKENKPLQFVDSTRDFWSSLAFQITPEENALVQAAFPGLEFHTATRGTLGPSSEAETLKMKKVRTTDPSPFPIKRKGVTPFSGTPGKKVRVDTKPHSTLKPSGQPVQPTENVVLDNEGPSGDLGSTSGFDNTRASEAVTDLDWFLQNGPSDPALAEAEKGFSQLKADLTGLQQSKRLAKGPLLEAGVRVLPSTEKKKSEDESTSPESSPFVPGTLGAWFMEGARLFSSLEDRVDGFDDRLTALEQRIHHLERSRSRRQ